MGYCSIHSPELNTLFNSLKGFTTSSTVVQCISVVKYIAAIHRHNELEEEKREEDTPDPRTASS